MSTLAKAQSYKIPQVISLLLLHKFSNFTQKKKNQTTVKTKRQINVTFKTIEKQSLLVQYQRKVKCYCYNLQIFAIKLIFKYI